MLKRIYNAICRLDLSFLGSKLNLQGNGPKVVGYVLPDGNNPHLYPLRLAPQSGATIVMPQQGKNYKKGPGEQWLALWIWSHRIKGFYDNLTLTSRGHRYEPDLAYIDEQRGIYIDIENDEPYTMGKRTPTHYLGKDDQRNENITAAGWIVLRFSEKQCIDSPARVARTIMDVVRSIAPEVEIPRVLQNVQPVDTDPRWDIDTARQHAKSRYRDSYMNKHFILRLGNLFFKL